MLKVIISVVVILVAVLLTIFLILPLTIKWPYAIGSTEDSGTSTEEPPVRMCPGPWPDMPDEVSCRIVDGDNYVFDKGSLRNEANLREPPTQEESRKKCQEECEKVPSCTAAVYTPGNKNCHLKKSEQLTDGFVIRPDQVTTVLGNRLNQ